MKKLPSKFKENIIRSTGTRHPTLKEMRTALGDEMQTVRAAEVDQAGDRTQMHRCHRKDKSWTKKTLISQTERTVCELCAAVIIN